MINNTETLQTKPLYKDNPIGGNWRMSVEELRRGQIIAESLYAKTFGPRDVTVHVRWREIRRTQNSYHITPRMVPYIERYPTNVVVFMTVDLESNSATFNGWAYLRDLGNCRKTPMGNGGFVVWDTETFPNPMNTIPIPCQTKN